MFATRNWDCLLHSRCHWHHNPTFDFKAGPEGEDHPGRWAQGLSPPSIGSLIQVPMSEKGKITRGRLGSLSLKKEGERQCFLFSKHLIICTRGSGGKLHLTKVRPAGEELQRLEVQGLTAGTALTMGS